MGNRFYLLKSIYYVFDYNYYEKGLKLLFS